MSDSVTMDARIIQNKARQDMLAKMKALGSPAQQEQLQAQKDKVPQKDVSPAIKWSIENKNGQINLKATPVVTEVDVTSVNFAKEVKSPELVTFLGAKVGINVKDKIEDYIGKYTKFFVQSKSHNPLVGRFAEMKMAFFGMMLSMLGVTSEELRTIQKKAAEGAISKNRLLFEENEYTGELLSIVGGSKKYIRTQSAIVNEIRNQIITQCDKLGLKGYYTKERVLQTQIEQCRKILSKFSEEKLNLEYQLSIYGGEQGEGTVLNG